MRLPRLLRRPDGSSPLGEEPFLGAIRGYAVEHHLPVEQVEEAVSGYLGEMLASHGDRATRSWNAFGTWMLRAHDILVDEEEMLALRQLDRRHTLALVFSHRSYLDGYVLPSAFSARRFGPVYTFGGANLDLPLLGRLASQTGIIFIRRSTKDLPLYRLTLRSYIAHLARSRANLAWSIEGGRTRTGKLRPPVHGILRYLVDAVEQDADCPDVMVVPVSIVYDQLHEVAPMTDEATGSAKRPEDLRWLVNLARSQGQRLGRVYLNVGTPIPLRERTAQLREAGLDTSQRVERVALDVSHRINRVTPVTVTAVVCLALLGADRALGFERVLATVEPLAAYIAARTWPVAGGASLTDRSTIRRALHELSSSGVLEVYDAGTEPVWRVADDRHLVAAFYRNTMIHILVDRAIGEVALYEVAWVDPEAPATVLDGAVGERDPAVDPAVGDGGGDGGGDAQRAAWERATELRDLLKFEFFFPPRAEFEQELRAELAILAPGTHDGFDAAEAAGLLDQAGIFLAHLVLRPFVDAYLVVADRLAEAGELDLDDAGVEELLTESLHLGEQWVLERRIASAESVSLEHFRNAVKLARHRGLLTGAEDTAALAERRAAFRAELARTSATLHGIAQLADALQKAALDTRTGGDGAAR